MKQKNPKILATPKDCYNTFPGKNLLTSSEFNNIIKAFTLNLLNAMLTKGLSFKIPYGLGILGITKIKNRGTGVNWKKSKEIKKIVAVKHDHSNNWVPQMFWKKTRAFGATFTFTDDWRIRWSKFAKKAMFYEAIENNNVIKYY